MINHADPCPVKIGDTFGPYYANGGLLIVFKGEICRNPILKSTVIRINSLGLKVDGINRSAAILHLQNRIKVLCFAQFNTRPLFQVKTTLRSAIEIRFNDQKYAVAFFVRQIRIIHRLTQLQAARLLGYKSKTVFQRWESGDVEPSFTTVVEIVRTLAGEDFYISIKNGLIKQDQ